ncbi:S26 family signal peptidase [Halorubrum trueperi]|uniref:S26 family signal peptidase n=1 Tax=Halorubrum trueperi TaxID=2004704 RepID=A0ABD5UJY4_9EURY
MDEGDRPRPDDELSEETDPTASDDPEATEDDERTGENDDPQTKSAGSNDFETDSNDFETDSNDFETDPDPLNGREKSHREAEFDEPNELDTNDSGDETTAGSAAEVSVDLGPDHKTGPPESVSGGAVEECVEVDETPNGRGESGGDRSLLYRFRHDREGALMWIREMLSSVAIVLVIGLILFGVSGVWPPMVAVESGSMEPNMEVGDLVFVTEPGRLAPDAADNDVGVVTHEIGESVDYRTFGSYGSVVIYRPPGRTASPIIHRAMFHVEAGENWYDRADGEYHDAASCDELRNCPAPHDGYITLGDNNGAYDQARGLSEPVKPEWVTGVARVRVPYLGYVRLIATGQAEPGDVIDAALGTVTYGPFGNGVVSGGTEIGGVP